VELVLLVFWAILDSFSVFVTCRFCNKIVVDLRVIRFQKGSCADADMSVPHCQSCEKFCETDCLSMFFQLYPHGESELQVDFLGRLDSVI